MTGPAGTGTRGPLVVGLGSPDRGDDAVGRAVARSVALLLPGVVVVDHEDPTSLLDLWDGHDPVVVVDAVRSGSPAGTLHRVETGAGGAPVSPGAWARTGHGGTHAVGLSEMVELGRALGRLPARLVVVGIEAECFDHGVPLTPRVAEAVPEAAARVCLEVGTALQEGAGDVPR
ncbi:hydrogenase maturation protease [Nocardioides sp.]|uniref:hydrogenase maturation protease n=1 Tax=Nocardioides sp. TaxID=35761 RepID=UPI001A2DEDE2|nr:hydrogenase maturation protease [Nocardioides sp.]MBJ7357820.1 hydrogenase maturation protease [Nocardioides sp.]